MAEIERTVGGKRRIYIPDPSSHQGEPGSEQQRLIDDVTLRLHEVESATQHIVMAINRGVRANLSEHNLTEAIERARRSLAEYRSSLRQPNRMFAEVETEYMNVITQAEEVFGAHRIATAGTKSAPVEAGRWKPSEKKLEQLRRLNLTLEKPVPAWMLTLLADTLENNDIMYITQNQELVGDLREQYDTTPKGIFRGVQAATLSTFELLNAARLLPVDAHEHHAKELYDMRSANAVAFADDAAEEWRTLMPAVAEKYETMSHHATELIELVGRYYEFSSGADFDMLSTISHLDIARLTTPEATLESVQDAIEVRMNETAVLFRVFNETYDETEGRRGAETRLWKAIHDVRELVTAVEGRSDVDNVTKDRYHSAYLHLVGISEQILNAVDARERATLVHGERQTELDYALDVDAERTYDVEVLVRESHAVERVCTENGLDLPLYARQFIAAAYYAVADEEAAREENDHVDEQYEYILTTDAPPLTRRVVLRDILPGMLRRAGLEQVSDHGDREGNEHRAIQCLQQLIEDWEQAYPPVAEKYRILQQYWDEMLDTIMNLDLHYPVKKPEAKK